MHSMLMRQGRAGKCACACSKTVLFIKVLEHLIQIFLDKLVPLVIVSVILGLNALPPCRSGLLLLLALEILGARHSGGDHFGEPLLAHWWGGLGALECGIEIALPQFLVTR